EHVGVIKKSHHVQHGVGFSDIREELIAKPFALACPFDEARNIHKLNSRGYYLLASGERSKLCKPRIRHAHHSHCRVDGAKRIVFRGHASFSKRIKKRGFPHVRKTDDTDAKHSADLTALGAFAQYEKAPVLQERVKQRGSD